jgi:hypothetical protein
MNRETFVTAVWTLILFILVPLLGSIAAGWVNNNLTMIYAGLIAGLLGACFLNYIWTLHLLKSEKKNAPGNLPDLKLQMKWEAELIGATVFAVGLSLSIFAFNFAEHGLNDALSGTAASAAIETKVQDALVKMFPIIPALLAAIGVGIANSKKLALARFDLS